MIKWHCRNTTVLIYICRFRSSVLSVWKPKLQCSIVLAPKTPLKLTWINISVANLSLNKNNFPQQPKQASPHLVKGLPCSEVIKRLLMKGKLNAAVDLLLAFDTKPCHLINSWWCWWHSRRVVRPMFYAVDSHWPREDSWGGASQTWHHSSGCRQL